MQKPEECAFCLENESVSHLFFDRVVAKVIWPPASDFFHKQLGANYESIAKFWLSSKRHAGLNSICATVLWCIWKTRNNIIFNNAVWISCKRIWWLILQSLQKWKIIFKQEMMEVVEAFYSHMHLVLQAPPPLAWH
ncbi:hypothetical protein BRADI_1g04835v3 [Brachypodium distachyon]|uniref:Reverse transcriptase zinc-binding domain-containing protein n=1 Tax=Brachypodium distachyon TaxID=15368 RepID=A0A0Q3J3Q5_BRADI|nr:hypothetical protein BRADI_1g04835v3 [Brachypodium distachyon]